MEFEAQRNQEGRPDAAALGVAPWSNEDQQRIRVAWLYYVAGLTQEKIGRRLGLTRARVNRLLADGRADGTVQFHIRSKLANTIELEQRLIDRYGLARAIVVPAMGDTSVISQAIGSAAGPYLESRLRDGLALGVGWGKTIHATSLAIPLCAKRNLKVVSLFGGLSRSAAINPYEIASRFAAVLNAECFYVTAPLIGGTPDATRALMQNDAIRAIFERIARVDIAIVSVGDLAPGSTNIEYGLLSAAERRSLIAKGAIGDIFGYYIDADGKPVDHPLNRCVIMPPLTALKRIPEIIVASGGEVKAPILRAVLGSGFVKALITDDTAARVLVREDKQTQGRKA
jgi:DNA-binding transcriptional regulator LsrR (DeoR family)